MPTCPYCREIYFGSPDLCPKCYYEFKSGLVKKPSGITQQEKYEREQQLKKEAEARKRAQQEHDSRTLALLNNARYEYSTEYLDDSRGGIPDKGTFDRMLSRYANDGWRLHSVITNEAGKNASAIGVGGFAVGSNSTMDVTILIFERCIKQAGQ